MLCQHSTDSRSIININNSSKIETDNQKPKSEEGVCIILPANPNESISRGYSSSNITIDKVSFIANPKK